MSHVTLVTGASRGIGKAIVEILLKMKLQKLSLLPDPKLH